MIVSHLDSSSTSSTGTHDTLLHLANCKMCDRCVPNVRLCPVRFLLAATSTQNFLTADGLCIKCVNEHPWILMLDYPAQNTQ